MARRYQRIAATRGGCERCGATWHEPNAHMLAAKHAKDTGHRTWSQTSGGERHQYGAAAQQPRMI